MNNKKGKMGEVRSEQKGEWEKGRRSLADSGSPMMTDWWCYQQ